MLSQVCVRVLLVTLGCTVHVGAGILCRSAELEASRETAFRATVQPCSGSLLTQESASGISGEELGSEQGELQPKQTENKNSKLAPTASEGRPECACRGVEKLGKRLILEIETSSVLFTNCASSRK